MHSQDENIEVLQKFINHVKTIDKHAFIGFNVPVSVRDALYALKSHANQAQQALDEILQKD